MPSRQKKATAENLLGTPRAKHATDKNANGSSELVVDFVSRTRYEELTKEVVNEVKLLILDSIGCALAGMRVDKAKYGISMGKKLGGSSEATIWGSNDKISCTAAGFANGEMINALDWDAFTYPTHAPPVLIPSVVAVAEKANASGRQVILSLAVSFELAGRLGVSIAGTHGRMWFDKVRGSEVGKMVGTKYSCSVINPVVPAAAMGIGKIMQFDNERMSNLLGLGVHFAPVSQAKWRYEPPGPMTKYVCCGWGALSAIAAAQLASTGFTADTSVLDGDLGYWRTFGGDTWEPSALTANLGRKWIFTESVVYKQYPCNGFYPVSIACFNKIIDDNSLSPHEIKDIKVQSYMGPWPLPPPELMQIVSSHVHAEFHTPYVFSLLAHKVPPAHWQDDNKMTDPEIHEFMKRVSLSVSVHPDFVKVRNREPGSNMTTVEVIARGKTFRQEGKFHKLAPNLESAHITADEIKGKFRNATADVISEQKAERIIETVTRLEEVGDISELIQLLTL